ncbi:hypothetical protein CFOL_v3_22601 [Cephalotus follicularis]|uniref:Uncharacterized protein n=1 Tax=Cephalotus follicularis TaxID=3775 RepID=A0A1Q3CFU7_CEPFO|nr:hypothetical protein CFOL_v3_22601 [Cephalotus follicularis]
MTIETDSSWTTGVFKMPSSNLSPMPTVLCWPEQISAVVGTPSAKFMSLCLDVLVAVTMPSGLLPCWRPLLQDYYWPLKPLLSPRPFICSARSLNASGNYNSWILSIPEPDEFQCCYIRISSCKLLISTVFCFLVCVNLRLVYNHLMFFLKQI